MLALHLLWKKLLRPLVLITASIHLIEIIVNLFKTIREYEEGLIAAWPIAITVVWNVGSTLRIVGIGALGGFYFGIVAIPLAEWPIIFLQAPMRLLRLQRFPLFSATARARARLDDGDTQVTLSLVGSVGGIIYVIIDEWGTVSHIINAPPVFGIGQLAVYVPGLAVIVLCFFLGVKLYIGAVRFTEPYKKEVEGRLLGHAAVAAAGPEVLREPGSGSE